MIKLVEEPFDCPTLPPENCCFCRTPTRMWYKKNDVACCSECAERADPEDVPQKSVWLRRERIAMGREDE
jgi:hypothetical protein